MGQHAAAIRGQLPRSMLTAALIGAAASVVLPIGLALVLPVGAGLETARWTGTLALP